MPESELSNAELMRTLRRIEESNKEAFARVELSNKEAFARIESRLDKALTLEVFTLYQEGQRREMTEVHTDLADMQANSARRAAELEAGSKERNVQVNNRIETLELKHDTDVAALRGRIEQTEAATAATKNEKAKLYITAAIGVVASIVIAIVSKGLGL